MYNVQFCSISMPGLPGVVRQVDHKIQSHPQLHSDWYELNQTLLQENWHQQKWQQSSSVVVDLLSS